MTFDYKSVGMKAGIEIHQQLDTHKLFCECPSEITDEKPDFVVPRRLHAVASEMGEYDPAALHERRKSKQFNYRTYRRVNCLVELDEEPPHPVNQEALTIAAQVAMLFNADIVPEVQVMRKTVIDGSNTAGFQRTMLVAMDGKVDTPEGKVDIPTFCLEEDAARIVSSDPSSVTYSLDRLGIPLVEVVTAPQIKTPQQVREVAYKLGSILRSCKIKRGLGSIRQDVSVSVRGGTRIEIKGVQDLDLMPDLVHNEVIRQLALVEISKELKKRDAKVKGEIINMTDFFRNFSSPVIKKVIDSGGGVFAISLPGFERLIGREINPNRRLGTELSEHARPHVAGLLHSDELPAHGITEVDLNNLKQKLGSAFILIAAPEQKAKLAFASVIARAKQAIAGVPGETRKANLDATSSYMRPLPGAARMYPETDVPPKTFLPSELKKIRESLPELLDKKVARFEKKYQLSHVLAKELADSGFSTLFERSVSELGINPSVAADALVSVIPSLRRDGIPVENLDDSALFEIFTALAEGKVAKEALPNLLTALSKGVTLSGALEASGGSVSIEELRSIAHRIVSENSGLVRERGEHAFQPLMGLVMKQVRGKVDGKIVADILKEELS